MSFTRPLIPLEAKSWQIPSWIYATCTDGVNLTCYTQEDLFSASIPAALGTTISSGPITLSSKYVGLCNNGITKSSLVDGMKTVSTVDAPGWRWAQMNLGPGAFGDVQGVGNTLIADKAVGSETLFKIYDTPTWASARPAEGASAYSNPGGKAEPANMSSLAAYVTWFMTNWGQYIDYIGVFNEPKYTYAIPSSFYSGTPAKLAEMHRTVWQTAKAIKPSVKILGPDVTGVTSNGVGSGIDYCNQFLAASDGASGVGANWIDVLTVHTYSHDGANTLTSLTAVKGYLDTIKAANGISNMPVWSTEFGFITPEFDDAYPGPMEARMRQYARYLIYNALAGMERVLMYSYKSGLGWEQNSEGDYWWNYWAKILNGATITRINRVGSAGQLACVINGVNYLV